MSDRPAAAYLYRSIVRHNRVGRVKHRLQYRVYSLLLDVDRLDDPSLPHWFSHNRFNLLSFRNVDHGAKDGTEPRAWIERELRAAGANFLPAHIRLFCFPRVLGHVFNPLSVWFIADEQGQPRATLYEVRNTFGEWHNYLFWSTGTLDPRHGVSKGFYVSPFLDMLGGYNFVTKHPPLRPSPRDVLTVSMNRHDGDGPALHASQTGRAEPLTNRSILNALITTPLMTLKVVIGIHVEALQLFFKGAKFHHRPTKPKKDTTAIEVEALPEQALLDGRSPTEVPMGAVSEDPQQGEKTRTCSTVTNSNSRAAKLTLT